MKNRLAIVSNFYPPNAYGGYEIATAQVVDALAQLGWDIQVLTSKEVPQNARHWVYPWLESSRGYKAHLAGRISKFRYLVAREKQNISAFRRFIQETKPDVIYFWNTAYTCNCLIPLGKASGIPTGWFAFDYGLVNNYGDLWEKQMAEVEGNPFRKTQRLLLKIAAAFLNRPCLKSLHLDFIHYPTRYLKDFYSNIFASEWKKIDWGIDVEKFKPSIQLPKNKLLFVGQISHHKGVELMIQALSILRSRRPDLEYELTIAGHAHEPEFETKLRDMVQKSDLSGHVRFIGFAGRDAMPELYTSHSILVFPSIWPEPMGITILEAMASGLCVLASGTGGSRELYSAGETGYEFQSENAADLAQKLEYLLSNPEIVAHTGQNARQAMTESRKFKVTINQIHSHLIQAANSRASIFN
jgi:glycogen(starch) synthase